MTGFEAKIASRVSGLSTAMIGYLCKEGFVGPSVSGRLVRGRRRVFSYTDLLIMRTLATLLKRGVEIRRLKASLKVLREKYSDLEPTTLPFRFLATDGVNIFEIVSEDRVLRLDPSSQYEFWFVLDLVPIERDVLSELRKIGRAA